MLELYQSEFCDDCGIVREKLSELGLSYVVHNPRLPRSLGATVTNEQTYAELTAIGGEDRFPFLVDTRREHCQYGEDEIVAYLEAHYEE